MRCPACGFENIPGLTVCGACSTRLDGGASPRDVTPPRAHDRSVRAGLLWRLRRAESRPSPLPSPGAMWKWFLVAASIIPGVGVRVGGASRRTAALHGIGALCLVLLGALLFRYAVSDLLLTGAVALCVYSAVRGWDNLLPAPPGMDRWRLGFARSLLAIAVLTGGYSLGRYAVRDRVWTVDVNMDVVSAEVEQGDRVLLRALDRPPRRGELVYAPNSPSQLNQTLFGPIIGVPGDRLVFDTPIFVNGRPTIVGMMDGGGYEMTLGPDEYWINPVWRGNAGEGRGAAAGLVSRQGIRGRAVAIVYPRARRARIHLEDIFQTKDGTVGTP